MGFRRRKRRRTHIPAHRVRASTLRVRRRRTAIRQHRRGLIFLVGFIIKLIGHGSPALIDGLIPLRREALARELSWDMIPSPGVIDRPRIDNLRESTGFAVGEGHQQREHPSLKPMRGERRDLGNLAQLHRDDVVVHVEIREHHGKALIRRRMGKERLPLPTLLGVNGESVIELDQLRDRNDQRVLGL